jgi:hypothetical protein
MRKLLISSTVAPAIHFSVSSGSLIRIPLAGPRGQANQGAEFLGYDILSVIILILLRFLPGR